jgi:hypothetical protein
MFSRTSSCGIRLYDWKTKPSVRLLISESSSSDRSFTSCPRIRYEPCVGRSMQPRMLSSVDFPEPDAPMIDQYSPAPNVNENESSAETSFAPIW